MSDRVLDSFLERQVTEGIGLTRRSDLVELQPLDGHPPRRYLARFSCRGLVRAPGTTTVREASEFFVGIWFPTDYLRATDASRILTWLGPQSVWHPNIKAPLICVGHVSAGTPLTALLYRCHELVTYNRFTADERDALNWEACAWARRSLARFPVDRRPLAWRAPRLEAGPGECGRPGGHR